MGTSTRTLRFVQRMEGKLVKIVTGRNFPCFGQGCMNQPLVYHIYSGIVADEKGTLHLSGGFNGTYDLDADLSEGAGTRSFFSVSWQKNVQSGSRIFSNSLTTSTRYPWLLLYLRVDAAEGFNGGYHPWHDEKESPNFKVKLTLDVKLSGGSNSQFYLIDTGSCWKNNGYPCDGDVLTDVTIYNEMIINPAISSWCRPDNLVSCPPYHTRTTGEIIHTSETSRFSYSAYHLYCSPGNAEHIYVIHTVALKHKSLSKYCLIESGRFMVIPRSKEMVGLGTQGLGS